MKALAWIRSKVDGAVVGAARALGLRWITRKIRAAAEGDLGPRAEAVYWMVAGKKTAAGLLLLFLAAGAAAAGQTEALNLIGGLGGALVSVGLVDRAWRTEAPASIKASRVWRALAENSKLLTLAIGTAYTQLLGCSDEWCSWLAPVVLALGAGLAQLGLVDAGWRSAKPTLKR